MTIKELRELISDIDENTEVILTGGFGKLYDIVDSFSAPREAVAMLYIRKREPTDA